MLCSVRQCGVLCCSVLQRVSRSEITHILYNHPNIKHTSKQSLWIDSTHISTQEWKNRTPDATNLSIVHFLVLPGSQSSFTEITKYTYFSLISSARKLQYEIELNILPLVLINGLIPFLVKQIYYTSSCSWQPECDVSILGRIGLFDFSLYRLSATTNPKQNKQRISQIQQNSYIGLFGMLIQQYVPEYLQRPI